MCGSENAATAPHIFKFGALGSPITSIYKCLSYRGESKVKVKNFICFVLVPARATVSSRELWGKKGKNWLRDFSKGLKGNSC